MVEDEEAEGMMPPKMRKRWIHRSLEALKDSNARGSASPSGSVASLESTINHMGGRGLNGIGLGISMSVEGGPLDSMIDDSEANASMDVDGKSNRNSQIPKPYYLYRC